LLLVAAALWLLGALLYMGVVESPGATEGGVSAWQHAWAAMGRLRSDEVLRRFVLTRALLLGTALSAPFYVALAAEAGGTMSGFGGLLLAQGAADFLSGPVWGRMSDRSSRRVMLLCAALATALGLAVLICASAQVQGLVGMLVYALAYGLLSVIHAGVRLARKTYVIDAAGADDRADYVAVSNTATGLLLLLGGALGSAAALLGPQYAVLLFAFGTAAAMVVGRRLPEVED
jgi:MFS family permease